MIGYNICLYVNWIGYKNEKNRFFVHGHYGGIRLQNYELKLHS